MEEENVAEETTDPQTVSVKHQSRFTYTLFGCKPPVTFAPIIIIFIIPFVDLCVFLINDVQVEHNVPEKTEEMKESEPDSQSKLVKQISESRDF